MSRKTKTPKEHNAVYRKVDQWFCMSVRGTNIRTELFAGLLMFLEVVCMSAVSAQLIAENAYIASYTTVYFGIMLVSAIGSILMGVLCNAPLIQSVSMGAVTMIVSTLSGYMGLTISNVLMIILISNLIYLIVMVSNPLRSFFAKAIPDSVRKALPAALGAYLIIYALSQFHIFGITPHNYSATLESMAAAGDALPWWGLNSLSFGLDNAAPYGWYVTTAVITAIVGFILMAVFQARRSKHAAIKVFLITLLVFAALWVIRGVFMDYYFYAFMTPAYGGMYFYDSTARISSEFNASLLFKSLTEGFDFSRYVNYQQYLQANALGVSMDQVTVDCTGRLIGIVATSVLSFLALGISETGAGLHASAFTAEAVDENGRIIYQSNPHFGKFGKICDVYSVNAFSSIVGSLLGGGPVAVRGESIVGAKEGAKTGLAAIVSGILCIAALFTVGFCGVFMNGMVVFGILIFTAMMLLCSFRNCDLSDAGNAAVFLVTVAAAAFTQNLGTAVLAGIVLNTVTKLLTGKVKELTAGSYILSVLAVALYILTKTL